MHSTTMELRAGGIILNIYLQVHAFIQVFLLFRDVLFHDEMLHSIC